MSRKKKTAVSILLLAGMAGYLAFSGLFSDGSAAERSTGFRGQTQLATFAGGCFWCMEPPFEKLRGVVDVRSGYTGGTVVNPTYEQVSHTDTGHLEAVQVTFDPNRISYEDLLQVFWRNINPVDDGGQFVDRGPSYTSAVFVHDEAQRAAAESSIKNLSDSGRFDRPIVTPVRDSATFYPAEDYHQDYYTKSPLKYKYYRYRSGRDQFLEAKWGDDLEFTPEVKGVVYSRPGDKEIREQLTPLQYSVTQDGGTEPAFRNEFWDHKKAGLYVDVVSGEPLFSSLDKFRSGTGWPSFTRPVFNEALNESTDYHLLLPRTELRSVYADSHLGHVFHDGPEPTGKRYCINSAALRFVAAADLVAEGYGEFANQFSE